ncbi:MAG TPA: PLP-dependent aminotransferase family protein [Candidatus Polarisedimenticolia bacterium]|nr:PLP-dependent aminotransferase family protein [Candidatus Polarisedimenticolia bacterium]
MTNDGPAMADWTGSLRRSALEEMLSTTARPRVVSLALGLPAPDLFPSGVLGELLRHALAVDARALQYGPPSEELKGFVARLMKRRGVDCGPDAVFLTAGAQQAMSLLARLLLEPGSPVIVESSSYTGFHQAVAPARARFVVVPSCTQAGIDLGAVERAMASKPRPALLYAMSDGHNPTGVSLPAASRRRLAAMAREHRVPILEDDAYGMLSYDGEERPCLRAFDDEWVFYIGSFSKTLAPALRTGWIVAPPRMVPLLSSLKESSDINTATLGQRGVAAFAASGRFDDHLAALRKAYALRRDAMVAALVRELPAGARWTIPRSGFFTWVELPDGLDAGALLEQTLARENVAFLPGAAFAAPGASAVRSAMRLSFSNLTPEAIAGAVAGIGRVLASLAGGRPGEDQQ